MAQVIWTETATLELEAIAEYLANYSLTYAKAVVKRLYHRTGQLASFPEMGRLIPEISNPRFRELIEGNYSVM
ncbi:type II toxin-antitoxin system RelE/ParE family toxin [Tellurirhabdus rosea]|uniref:type II toxin-antitoxin system RelE/ParE family toxin n=1 Tax=Tellurirhabdus rosea TaxID=2674997 RepID=UPI0022521249|nr:type II toxin-antitoxin system RelE/ParE family toxin [Tellurirhabdus rosea]